MTPRTALDLCAGAGGWSLGLHRAGFEVRGVEFDATACETHRAMVGPCDLADMTQYHPERSYDLVCGGVPCQSFSMAGARAGIYDDRGQLYRHLLRIAVEAKAEVCALENVRGLTNWRDEHGDTALTIILREFVEHGFHTKHRLLNAADYGVPQTRYRIFIVGFRDPAMLARFRWPIGTHSKERTAFTRQWVSVREALGHGRSLASFGLGASQDGVLDSAMDTITVRSHGAGGASTRDKHAHVRRVIGDKVLDAPVGAIGTAPHTGATELAKHRHVARVLGDKVLGAPVTTIACSGGSNSAPRRKRTVVAQNALDAPANTVSASNGAGMGGTGSKPRYDRVVSGLNALDSPAPTVTTLEGESALNFGSQGATTGPRKAGDTLNPVLAKLGGASAHRRCEGLARAAHPRSRVTSSCDPRSRIAGAQFERDVVKPGLRLSVAQCAALQSFPPEFVFTGTKTAQYKQVGNAVPPPLGEVVGRAILRALTKDKP